jgi:hypothetical protein
MTAVSRKSADRLVLTPDLYVATLEGIKTPEQLVIERQTWAMVERHIDDLQPRLALALRLRYGIRCEPHTLDQVGELFGVCRERVRQIVGKAERNLRYKVLREVDMEQWRRLEADRKAWEQAAKAKRDAQWAAEWEAAAPEREREAEQQRQEAIDRLALQAERRRQERQEQAVAAEKMAREMKRYNVVRQRDLAALAEARSCYKAAIGTPDERQLRSQYVILLHRCYHHWG